jgi:signal transduction histidine kinase
MGLALCQRIVEEHHGTISIESAPETGTMTTIVLPPA